MNNAAWTIRGSRLPLDCVTDAGSHGSGSAAATWLCRRVSCATGSGTLRPANRARRRVRPAPGRAYSSVAVTGRHGSVMETKFRIGKVIAVAVRVWARNLVPFLVLTAVMESPLIAWGAAVAQGHIFRGNADFHRWIVFESVFITTAPLMATVLSALVSYGVVMELQGRRVSIFTCIATGLSRLVPAFGTMVAASVCLGLMYFAGGLPGMIGGSAGVLVGGLGAMLYLATQLYVAPQAAVIDRRGMLEALGRSRELTRGHRPALFALLLLVLGVSYGMHFAMALIAWSIPALVGLDLAGAVVVGSLIATLPCVAYYYLRAEKEGSSAEELARVFD